MAIAERPDRTGFHGRRANVSFGEAHRPFSRTAVDTTHAERENGKAPPKYTRPNWWLTSNTERHASSATENTATSYKYVRPPWFPRPTEQHTNNPIPTEGVKERLAAIDQRRATFEELLNRATVSARRSAIKASKESGTKAFTKRTLKAQLRASLMRPNQEFDVSTLSKAGQRAYKKAQGMAASVKKEQRERRVLRWEDYLGRQEEIESKADEILLRQQIEGVNRKDMRELRDLLPDRRMVTDGYRNFVQLKNPLRQRFQDMAQPAIMRHERYIMRQMEIHGRKVAREAEIARIREEWRILRAAESARMRARRDAEMTTNPEKAIYVRQLLNEVGQPMIAEARRKADKSTERPKMGFAEIAARLRETINALSKFIIPLTTFIGRRQPETITHGSTPIEIYPSRAA